MKLTERSRKILERIIKQGHCSGVGCASGECPLHERYGDGFCNPLYISNTENVKHATELLAQDTLTQDEVEAICEKTCRRLIAEYIKKEEKPKGIEQFLLVGSTWKDERGCSLSIKSLSEEKIHWYTDTWSLPKNVINYYTLIDTGKISISDRRLPEGVPFIGFWGDNRFRDFMISDGELFVRFPEHLTISLPGSYNRRLEGPHPTLTHWQVSGPLAITAMEILRGK